MNKVTFILSGKWLTLGPPPQRPHSDKTPLQSAAENVQQRIQELWHEYE